MRITNASSCDLASHPVVAARRLQGWQEHRALNLFPGVANGPRVPRAQWRGPGFRLAQTDDTRAVGIRARSWRSLAPGPAGGRSPGGTGPRDRFALVAAAWPFLAPTKSQVEHSLRCLAASPSVGELLCATFVNFRWPQGFLSPFKNSPMTRRHCFWLGVTLS